MGVSTKPEMSLAKIAKTAKEEGGRVRRKNFFLIFSDLGDLGDLGERYSGYLSCPRLSATATPDPTPPTTHLRNIATVLPPPPPSSPCCTAK